MSMTLIEKRTLDSTVSSIEFTEIPQTYTDLMILSSTRATADGVVGNIRFNGDTGANYSARLGANANSGSTTIPLNASNSGARSGYLIIDNVIEAAPKIAIGNTLLYDINAAWFDTSALTSISLTSGTAFTAGTWTLYGIAA
jgi:hypothetical protein